MKRLILLFEEDTVKTTFSQRHFDELGRSLHIIDAAGRRWTRETVENSRAYRALLRALVFSSILISLTPDYQWSGINIQINAGKLTARHRKFEVEIWMKIDRFSGDGERRSRV